MNNKPSNCSDRYKNAKTVRACTKDNPFKDAKYHVDLTEIDQENGYPGGDIVYFYCPNCGLRFSSELPQ